MPENKKVALKIEGLNKTLGKRHILHDIAFEAYEGEVFGFLGPNGAGKTTTIKCAVGLISMDSGKIEIEGKDVNKDFEGAMANVGGIVENPEMYKYLTARQNLEQYARMRDGVTPERIEEVAKIVGLSNRIDEKVGKYSLGMRQRIGVAQAILHKPKLLILDEPTNHFDPETQKIIGENFRDFQGTLMVVSHSPSFVEQIGVTRMLIIEDGKAKVKNFSRELLEYYYYLNSDLV